MKIFNKDDGLGFAWWGGYANNNKAFCDSILNIMHYNNIIFEDKKAKDFIKFEEEMTKFEVDPSNFKVHDQYFYLSNLSIEPNDELIIPSRIRKNIEDMTYNEYIDDLYEKNYDNIQLYGFLADHEIESVFRIEDIEEIDELITGQFNIYYHAIFRGAFTMPFSVLLLSIYDRDVPRVILPIILHIINNCEFEAGLSQHIYDPPTEYFFENIRELQNNKININQQLYLIDKILFSTDEIIVRLTILLTMLTMSEIFKLIINRIKWYRHSSISMITAYPLIIYLKANYRNELIRQGITNEEMNFFS